MGQKRILLVSKEEIYSCVARRDVFLCYKKRFLLASQEDISSCRCIPVLQEEISSCVTRRYFFLCHKKRSTHVVQSRRTCLKIKWNLLYEIALAIRTLIKDPNISIDNTSDANVHAVHSINTHLHQRMPGKDLFPFPRWCLHQKGAYFF